MAAVAEDPVSELGRLVRARRQGAGLTQQALASLVGVSVATVRDLEQGRTRRPRRVLLDRLSVALDLPPEQLPEPGFGSAARPPAAPVRSGAALRLNILGPVTAWRDGRPLALGDPRQRGVLGFLALHAGVGVHRSSLVDALWGQRPPPAAVNLVQAYVGRLRRVIDPGRSPRDAQGVLVSTGTSYRMQIRTDHLDWLLFRRLVSRAAADGDAAAIGQRYERALRLWRGDALADVDVLRGHPAVAVATREWAAAVAGYAEAALQAGTAEPVLPYLWQWVGTDPLNEKAHALLMLALAEAGQQADALEVFAAVRGRLDAELGVRPGPDLSQAHLRILRQDAVTISPPPARGLAWVIPRQLPTPVRHFAGRLDELSALDALLESVPASAGPVLAAITGTAGIGKSALALQWAHRAADRFPDGQLYVNLRGYDPVGPPLDPLSAVRGFLESLGTAADAMPREPHAQVALYRSLLSGRRVLVVLDNVHDGEQARPLLPGTAGVMALITSRDELTGLAAGEGAARMPLALLGAAESRRLLAGHVGADRIVRHAETADELVELCAHLPLALSIIGARAAGHPDLPLETLVSQLRDARGRLDALCAGESSSDLRAILSCSYQNLSQPAARMFRLLGLHPGPDISAAAAASLAAVPVTAVTRLLNELTRTHLITEHAPGRYTFHDLLRAYAAEQALRHDSADDRRAALHRMLDHYLHTAYAAALLQEPPRDPLVLPTVVAGVVPEDAADDAAAAAWFAGEHSVLLGCVALAAQSGHVTHAWQLAWTLMTAFSRRGRCDDLSIALRLVMDAGYRANDLTAQAYAHRFLGRVRGLLGLHDEAYDHLQHALDLFERLGDLPGQAAAHIGLAREHELRAEPGPAVEHATQALKLQREMGNRIGEANGLNNLAWCYVGLGNYAQALDCCRQALALQQAIGFRPGEAGTWDTLGYVHHHLDQYAEAASCYDRALHLQHQLDDRYEQAGTLGRLGDTYAAAGDTPLAHGCWYQALAILEELHHPDAQQLHARLNSRRRS